MEIGIVGLPHSGKRTLFSTLLAHKSTDNAFKPRREVDRGLIRVSDHRLEKLSEIYKPKRKTHATVEYIMVPGLEAERRGEKGLPAQFLANLKSVDAILLVIRAFEDDNYPHPLGRVDPVADMDFVVSEFIFSDLCITEARIERLDKEIIKLNREEDRKERATLLRCREWLERQRPIRDMDKTPEEEKLLRGFQFLSGKPILLVINVAEADIARSEEIQDPFRGGVSEKSSVTCLCASIEREISELDPEDQAIFLTDMGIEEPALPLVIRKSYELLGLISFFTVGQDECRAWTIRRGSKAPAAAGAIHSDLERGFIRANVVPYEHLASLGDLQACKAQGLLRLEGKTYPIQDGDVVEILASG